uniref:G-protein coupled receptors family 1 profile domain-containing protein n=1 Tax=Loxodonta africana TaxID=9785 RepID=G3UJ14_LOXAF
PSFYTSMCFFLTNISFLDLSYTSSIVPQLLREQTNIFYGGCVVQLYISLGLGSTERILLGVIVFDHYTAVCRSLHYIVILYPCLCALVASASWLICFAKQCSSSFYHLVGEIEHFLCEVCPLLKHGCVDITMNESELCFVGVVILLIPTVLLFSYGQIVRANLHIKSAARQGKTFGTCGSRLTMVSLFYGRAMSNFISLFYTTVTPMISPLIYALWNMDVNGAFKKILWKAYNS